MCVKGQPSTSGSRQTDLQTTPNVVCDVKSAEMYFVAIKKGLSLKGRIRLLRVWMLPNARGVNICDATAHNPGSDVRLCSARRYLSKRAT